MVALLPKSPEALFEGIQAIPEQPDYKSYKKEWLNWVGDYIDPRVDQGSRQASAAYIYNHLQVPEWLLWLAEAVGVELDRIQLASEAAAMITSGRLETRRSGAIRRAIPWQVIYQKLWPEEQSGTGADAA